RYACDLAFVSNLSIDAGAFLEEQRRAAAPSVRRLMEALFDDLGPRIERGDAPASPVQANGLTRQIAARLGLEVSDAQADALRQGFTERLINIFFRHQVLTWASEMGLDLRLYGRGWEQHPTLAKHARGVA